MIVYQDAGLLVCQKPAGVDSESGETLRFSAAPPALWPWTLFEGQALDFSPEIR